jgi:hypothetical protein
MTLRTLERAHAACSLVWVAVLVYVAVGGPGVAFRFLAVVTVLSAALGQVSAWHTARAAREAQERA